VDDRTGYRYYRFDQSSTAAAIAELRALDVPLAEIAEIVAGDEVVAHERLEVHRRRLRAHLARTEERIAHVERLLQREPTMAYDIIEQSIPSQRVASLRVSGPNTAEANDVLILAGWSALWDAIVAAGGTEDDVTGSAVVVIHHGDEERFEQELCIPIDRVTPSADRVTVHELEAVRAAVARHHGPRPDVREVMAWAAARGHRVGVPFRITVVAAPPFIGEGTEQVCDIVVPLDAVARATPSG
jgi:DNA-binding transcriptional MerR regulator